MATSDIDGLLSPYIYTIIYTWLLNWLKALAHTQPGYDCYSSPWEIAMAHRFIDGDYRS